MWEHWMDVNKMKNEIDQGQEHQVETDSKAVI